MVEQGLAKPNGWEEPPIPSYHVVSPNGKVQKGDRRKARKMPFLPESIQLPLRRQGEQVRGA